MKFKPVVFCCDGDACYNRRYDLDTDGCISILDVVKLKPYLFTQCTNP
jgi:hypothetical protein